MPYLIFDFDGVLADTFVPLASFVSKKFRVSFARSVGKITSINLKNNQTNWFREKIQDYQSRKFLKWLKNNQENKENKNYNLVFEDIMAIVEKLSEPKFIITNNYLSICEFILKEKVNLFKQIYTYDNHLSKTDRLKILIQEHNLNLDRCLFFVDTVGDILEYKNLVKKEQIFAVNWGFHSTCLLKTVIDEKQILSKPEDIQNVILAYENQKNL